MPNRASKVASLILAVCILTLPPTRPATAGPECTDCVCEIAEDAQTETLISEEETTTNNYINENFVAQESWLTYLLQNFIGDALMDMTQQATTTAMMQTFIFGTFLDAQQQLEVQRTFQELAARAHKDYQTTDEDICLFGTLTQDVAATMLRGEANGYDMSEFGEMRRIGNANTSASEGTVSDRPSRLQQFKTRYCDLSDNNTGLGQVCTAQAPAVSVNRDLDYAGVMEKSLTLNIDPVDTSGTHPTDDEQDLLGLASNLYGHNALYRLPEHALRSDVTQTTMLDLRSIEAERSVAEASYYTIAGLRSLGTPQSTTPPINSVTAGQYMQVVLKELGVATGDMQLMLGTRPSYYAQMGILTKKIFQNAQFYTNLYDTPANVQRKRVAMQAIGLMQDFDMLQSTLRTEMMLSQLLELNVIKLQADVQNKLNTPNSSGPHGR